MFDVALTIHSPEGTKEVPFTGDHLTVGRSDDSALVIGDNGLSRVHASLHRDGDRVWILDEASTNGTYVNSAPVSHVGTPLTDGDEITLGNTIIIVNFKEPQNAAAVATAQAAATTNSPGSLPLPVIAAVVGIVVVLLAVVGIGSYVAKTNGAGNDNNRPVVVQKRTNVNNTPRETRSPATDNANNRAASNPTPAMESANTNGSSAGEPAGVSSGPIVSSTKSYGAMSQEERKAFVAQEAQHISQRIGNREGSAFTPEALNRIKVNVDAYYSRARAGSSSGCRFGQNLTTTLERASKSAPFINRAFNEKGLSPVIGLYLAMIESEYCVCLTSPTGPKGMFQFTRATAVTYGLQIIEPEERCIPEKAAPAAAAYMKALMGRYGTGPLSVPLSIASYNSGEGGLSSNLFKALDAVRSTENPERSFWTLVANADHLSDQFQKENIKYVPKFFGAAIIGENPRVFGVEMEPLSTYTQ